ncbi:MAG: NADH-quinone oxidoreductase subunit L [Akkermansiaceae bacterium]|jgi:NADH-quinone oxidoreductase subunit L|nr:NADH-quinone oxidoreductase subunit L [Akkermansiaceae bacterium]MDP4647151.1 NADH-quinone oxidoreductase subunit L [Akkermansiaceae bacterium]MDP4720462.1 NADH-quinone oxidoreductase subunit L [Akkermansiaceae bacterium]MDP4780445.1 NADH-quinone oxidoreductase subunit L [Akkermansiaceae bacterium]MDP4847762.1 NADH-quinone oxidoreductase subunit L [Akkermansiaceae bacterium]
MPWLLLILPLLAAVANQLFLRKIGVAHWVSTASAAATFVIALLCLGKTDSMSFNWASAGNLNIDIGITLDKLSTGMMIVVTGVGLLVHVFSLAYMKDDSAKARYFTGLALFMFSMTGIVLASNFIMTFIFWELVGLSSYLLIGHWYEKDSAADAAKKAFLTNRIGDFGFMIGILMLWGITGTLAFDGMKEWAESGGIATVSAGVLGAALLCVFCGAVGKSAQLPLHVWLPDAMEGPTPVSALIHAATMVAAGVYMLFRVQFSIGADAFEGFSGTTIAWIGGITSLAAALMATQQDDIKKILAYSTLSQLGYMVMAVGLLVGEAGMFHLFTHAWFKALLFLGSGAIIYACHHEQNIWKMGGLLKKMPITAITFAIGTAALIAVPYVTSGFWSKEEILAAAYNGNKPLFFIAVFVAFLTTFYMTRAFIITFLGKTRSENADHAKEVGPMMLIPLIALAVMALASGSHLFSDSLNAYRPDHGGGHAEGHSVILIASIASLVLGLAAGFVLYAGKKEDPISIPLFKNRFYLDAIYEKGIVKYFQDSFAAIVHFFDEFIINGLIVGGLSRLAESFGNLFRKAQSGNLQAYAFSFGLGVLLLIYFTVFH